MKKVGLLLAIWLISVSVMATGTMNLDVNQGADWEQKAVQLNVMHPKFGAKGDSSTNDAPALQDAVDSISARGGGKLFISDRPFYCSTTVNIPSNIEIEGVGWDSYIFKDPSRDYAIFANSDTTNGDTGITITGIRLDGQSACSDYDCSQAKTSDLIFFVNAHQITISGCYFTGSEKDAIKLRKSTRYYIEGNNFWDIGEEAIATGGADAGKGVIAGNIFIGQDSTYEGSGALAGMKGGAILSNASNITISDNYFEGWGTGVDVNYEGSDSLYNVVVTGNIFERFTGCGVAFVGSHHCQVSNNTFRHGTGYAVYFNRYLTTKEPDQIIVSNNIIDSVYDHTGLSREGVGIFGVYGSGHQIMGNKISNTGGEGISVSGITTSIILGNVCNLNDSIGIKAYDSDSCIIVNNMIWGDSIGVSLANTSDYCQLAGNYCNDNQTAAYYQIPTTSGNFKYDVGNGDSAYVTMQSVRDSGGVDSFFVAESLTTVTGWVLSNDTIFIDTSGGGGSDADSILSYVIQGTVVDNYILKIQISGSDTTWQIEADATGAGTGTEDSLVINAGGTEYSIMSNLVKMKGSTGITFTRDDSSTYDVIQVSNDLGTSIVTGEITDGTITEPDLNIDNSPVANDILSPGTGSDFTWKSIAELGLSDYDFDTAGAAQYEIVVFNKPGVSTDSDFVMLTASELGLMDTATIEDNYLRSNRNDSTDYDLYLSDAYLNYDGGSRYGTLNFFDYGLSNAVQLRYDTFDCEFQFTGMLPLDVNLSVGGEIIATTADIAGGITATSFDISAGADIGGDLTVGDASGTSYTLPDEDGSNGQILETDGSGAVSWSDNTAAGDTALVLASSAGGADWVKIQGDTLKFKLSGVTDTFFIYHDGTNWVMDGGGGLSVFDSALVDTLLYFVSPGDDDTTFITNVFLDSIRADAFGPAVAAQSVTKTHIDSTSSNVIFDDAYRGTSAEAESLYITYAGAHDKIDSLSGELSDAYCPILPDTSEIDSAGIHEWMVDRIGEMVSSNTESGIAVTFEDGDNTLDFAVDVKVSDSVCDSALAVDTANLTLATYLDNVMDTGDVADADNAGDVDTSGTEIAAALADRLRKDGNDTFTGILSIAGDLMVGTGNNILLGSTNWNSGDGINGESVVDNTLDEDAIDWGAGTDQVGMGDILDGFDTAQVVDTAQALDVIADNAVLAKVRDTVNVIDKHMAFTVPDPNAHYANDHEVMILSRSGDAFTISRIDVTCDADPTTELDFDLKWADAFIGFANAAVIDELNTTAGVTTITTGFDDATIPANKCIYLLFNAEPDANITQVGVTITFTYD